MISFPNSCRIQQRHYLYVFQALLLLTLAASAQARTWYVKPDGTGDAQTIQAAIDSATSGDEILLAAGTYTWTSQGASGESMTVIAAQVALRGEAGPEATVLDAEARGRVISCTNAGMVRIEGITVANGLLSNGAGAGIHSQGSSQPTISNCIVRNNETRAGEGGGVWCENGTIADCRILDNAAFWIGSSSGGGLRCRNTSISRCVVRGNSVGAGDGSASGGGIWLLGGAIADCWIEGNLAFYGPSARGGGAAVSGTVTRCTFITNQIGPGVYRRAGGGIDCIGDCEISDCVFARNTVEAVSPGWLAQGAAIAVESYARARIANCTMVGNEATQDEMSTKPVAGVAADGPAEVLSTIIAFNTGAPCGGSVSVNCTDVFGNSAGDSLCSGGRSFSADPEFCAEDPATSLNFTLQQDSLCLPGNHPPNASTCGLIGAAPVGCGTVSIEAATWGRLKSLYR